MVSYFSGFSIKSADIIFEELSNEGCHDRMGFYRADVFLLNNKISEELFINHAKEQGEYGATAYCLCVSKNNNQAVIKDIFDFMFSDIENVKPGDTDAEYCRSIFLSECNKDTPKDILLSIHERNWKAFSSIFPANEEKEYYKNLDRMINQLLYKNKY